VNILLIDAQPNKKWFNKTMAGGFGTDSSSLFSKSSYGKILQFFKKGIKVPLIEFAYLASIFSKKYNISISHGHYLKKADLYLIYGSLVGIKEEIRLSKEIRKKFPNSRIGFFGLLPTIFPDIYDEHSDFVISGEAESFFYRYSDNLKNLNGTIFSDFFCELDDLPFPNWSVFKNSDFRHIPFFGFRKIFPILGSRGCNFSCKTYCPYTIGTKGLVRFRSVESIIEEIKYLKKEYGIKCLLFRDPNFSIDQIRTRRLCGEMRKHKLNVLWAVETHPFCLNKDLIDDMFSAGCRAITMGIESANSKILSEFGRLIPSPSKLKELVRYAQSKGMQILAHYILGFPNENRESIEETINLSKYLGTDFANYNVFTPFPGTEFFNKIQPSFLEHWHKDYATLLQRHVPFTSSSGEIRSSNIEKIDIQKCSMYNSFTPIFYYNYFKSSELEKFVLNAFLHFYFSPKWILGFVFKKIGLVKCWRRMYNFYFVFIQHINISLFF